MDWIITIIFAGLALLMFVSFCLAMRDLHAAEEEVEALEWKLQRITDILEGE